MDDIILTNLSYCGFVGVHKEHLNPRVKKKSSNRQKKNLCSSSPGTQGIGLFPWRLRGDSACDIVYTGWLCGITLRERWMNGEIAKMAYIQTNGRTETAGDVGKKTANGTEKADEDEKWEEGLAAELIGRSVTLSCRVCC